MVSAVGATAPDPAAGGNPWTSAVVTVVGKVRRNLLLIIAVALLSALAGMAARILIPATYKATVQVLIDPRGLRIFPNDPSGGQLDANAAINFVESQMGVIKSERVLLRVLRDPSANDDQQTPDAAGTGSNEFSETKALVLLQRAITVQRNERSFVVDVTVAARSPQHAAALANAVVKAYIDEDQIDRNASMKRVTGELTGRLEGMRKSLREAEDKAEAFRVQNGLVGIRDKLVIEQRLTEATTALTLAESREAQIRGRLNQLSSSTLQMSSIGALGTDPESRSLALLLDTQAVARNDLEQLTGLLGEQHPTLVNARNRLKEIDKSIADALVGARKAAQSQLDQIQTEISLLSRKVSTLSADLSKARQAEVGLRSLQADVEGHRKILESFETKARETSEFGQIDGTSLRIISPARAPNAQGYFKGLLLWGIFGGLVGAILAVGGIAFATIFLPENAGQKAFVGVPVIEPYPAGKRPAETSGRQTEILGRPDSAFSASIKAVYKACLAAGRGGFGRKKTISVLVTSGQAGSGKTTVAANLAWMAAAAGRRVLLIEANPASPSLASVLPPDAPARLLKRAGVLRPIYRLAAGSVGLSVAPILANERDVCLRLALRGGDAGTSKASEDFDFIVFDGPVVVKGEQASSLAGAADRVVLVSTENEPAKPSFVDIVDWLDVPADKILRTVVGTPLRQAA